MITEFLELGYDFISFNKDELSTISPNQSKCLLRHDIDTDLEAALSMAKIEHKLGGGGVKSTYFLMLRSPIYNLMSRSSYGFVREIIDLGHCIGLHYDQGFDSQYSYDLHDTERMIRQQSMLMEEIFGVKIDAVSFHQPGKVIFNQNINCGKLTNTYDRKLSSKFNYFSDSNRVFSLMDNSKNLSESISNCFPENIQILIHPMWWVYEDKTTHEVWNRVIITNLNINQKQLLETERAYGEKRNFEIS